MVGVQGDPLVQHLPADAQLRVAALEELEGDRCQACAASKGPCQPRSTAPLVPSLLPFSFGAHTEVPPHIHPHVLPPLHAAGESQSCGDLGLEIWLLCPRPAVGCVRKPSGVTAPYRVQPLHLHVVLGVEVHADGHRLHPGVICVAWVVEVPLVYLCMEMPHEQSPHHLSEGTLGALGVGGALPCSSSAPLKSRAPFPLQLEPWGVTAAGTATGVGALPRGLWAAP